MEAIFWEAAQHGTDGLMSAELACENTVMPCRLISRSWGNVPPT